MLFYVLASSPSGSLPGVPWVMGGPNASFKWQVSEARSGKKNKRHKRWKTRKPEEIVIKIMDGPKSEVAKYHHVKVGATLKPENLVKVITDKVHKKDKQPMVIEIRGKISKERVNRIMGCIRKHAPVDNFHY